MTIFYLIRHAHCDCVGKSLAGWGPGVHLSPEGIGQAERLAEFFAGRQVDAVYCSPLERAFETAEPLALRVHTRIRVSDKLGEVRFGEWTGRSFGQLSSYPVWNRFNAFRSGTRVPKGDLMIEVQARIISELDRLRTEHPGRRLAVVSHADVIRSAIAFYAGIPLDIMQRIEISPASVSTLVLEDDGPRLMQINMTFDQTAAARGTQENGRQKEQRL